MESGTVGGRRKKGKEHNNTDRSSGLHQSSRSILTATSAGLKAFDEMVRKGLEVAWTCLLRRRVTLTSVFPPPAPLRYHLNLLDREQRLAFLFLALPNPFNGMIRTANA